MGWVGTVVDRMIEDCVARTLEPYFRKQEKPKVNEHFLVWRPRGGEWMLEIDGKLSYGFGGGYFPDRRVKSGGLRWVSSTNSWVTEYSERRTDA